MLYEGFEIDLLLKVAGIMLMIDRCDRYDPIAAKKVLDPSI